MAEGTVKLGPIHLKDQGQRKIAIFAAIATFVGLIALIDKHKIAAAASTGTTAGSDVSALPADTSGSDDGGLAALEASTAAGFAGVQTNETTLAGEITALQQAAAAVPTTIGVTFADNFGTSGTSSSSDVNTTNHSGSGSAGINIFGITIGGTGGSNSTDSNTGTDSASFTQANSENLGFTGLQEGDLPTVDELLNELTGAQQLFANGSASNTLGSQQLTEITATGLPISTSVTQTGVTTVVHPPAVAAHH